MKHQHQANGGLFRAILISHYSRLIERYGYAHVLRRMQAGSLVRAAHCRANSETTK